MNFGELRETIRNYKIRYEMEMESLKEELMSIRVNRFDIPRHFTPRNAFSADGSFITYWKAPIDRFFIGGVRVAWLEEFVDDNKYYDNADASSEFVFMDFSSIDKNSKITPRNVLSYVMSLREKQVLVNYAKNNKNSIIMIDGSIVESFSDISEEKKELYRRVIGDEKFSDINRESSISDLITYCRENGHILVGVAKESKALAVSGKLRYEVALENVLSMHNLPKKAYYYYRVPMDTEYFRKYSRVFDNDSVEIVFVKLHPKARKWHRIDVLLSENTELMEVFYNLSAYSQYIQFLGTPRPPQICDSLASEINTRKMSVVKSIRKILMEEGFTFTEIYYGETDFGGEKMIHLRTFHDLADRINRTDRTFKTI